MNTIKKILIFGALVLNSRSECLAEIVPAKAPLKIGVVLGLTGDAAVHSKNMKDGLTCAQQKLREQGVAVDLTFEDDGTDPKRTIAAFQSLLWRDFHFFIGPAWSYQVPPVLPILQKAGAVTIAPATFSEIATPGAGHIFYGVSAGEAEVRVLRDWLKAQNIRKIATLVAEGSWGEAHEGYFLSAARGLGIEVTSSNRYSYGSEQSAIPAVILKIKSQQPDAILSTGSADGEAVIANSVAKIRAVTRIVGTEDMQDAADLRLFDPSVTPGVEYTLIKKSSPAFAAIFKGCAANTPGIYADSAYDSLMVLVHAIQSSDGSPAGVRKILSKDFQYQGVTGVFSFDEHGDVHKEDYEVREVSKAPAATVP